MPVTTELGTVKNHGFDADGYERRERLESVVDCSVCDEEVALWSDTESWVVKPDGKRLHSSYGPAQGCCCGRLYVHSFEGCFEYKMRESNNG